jgi:ABC-2 type transport system permease protein
VVAAWNPLSYSVSGARSLFVGVLDAPAVYQALAVTAALAAVTVTWASRAFARGLR